MNTEPLATSGVNPAETKIRRIREGRRVAFAAFLLWCAVFASSSLWQPQEDVLGCGDQGSCADIYYGHPVWGRRFAYELNFDAEGFNTGPASYWTAIYSVPLAVSLLWTAVPSLLLMGGWLSLRGQPIWRNRAPRDEAWIHQVVNGWDRAADPAAGSSPRSGVE